MKTITAALNLLMDTSISAMPISRSTTTSHAAKPPTRFDTKTSHPHNPPPPFFPRQSRSRQRTPPQPEQTRQLQTRWYSLPARPATAHKTPR
ncbi:hypothetical protein PMIN04_011152 [Paraphaeosphaeria minitans]